MGVTSIPVDLLNPGQVFACLGLMEATEVLAGPCVGRFAYEADETQTEFTLATDAASDPVAEVLGFLARAQVKAVVSVTSDHSAAKWDVATFRAEDEGYPCPEPDSPAALPVILTDGSKMLEISHWADGGASRRDNVKFWGGSGGYSGAQRARDALQNLSSLGDNAVLATSADPFAFSVPQSSSFRFDWRRDYIPLDAGFSPNEHSAVKMMGYPLVELLAAIGLQNARPACPSHRDKLAYRYGVSNIGLPTLYTRAVIGVVGLGFPMRIFRVRLGWPAKKNQERCIVDTQEEFTHD